MFNRLKKFFGYLNLFHRIAVIEQDKEDLVSELNKEIDVMHKAYRFSLGALTGENKFRTDTGQILPKDDAKLILVLEEKIEELRKNLEMLKGNLSEYPEALLYIADKRIQGVEDYMRIERTRR